MKQHSQVKPASSEFENRIAVRWFALGALLAAIGVGLGAFGAHGLENAVQGKVADPAKSLEYWGTANRYLMYHSFAIMVAAIASLVLGQRKSFSICSCLFVLGIVLFSGCLYAMALTDFKKLGMIVPFGGLSHIVGWLILSAGLLSASHQGNKTP